MSESAGLEDGYRRLLAWYPRSFRQEQEDEMLAVLMASAEPGQRRPRWLERADLIKSALTVRLVRALRPAPVNQGWSRALAVFGVIAPVFLVIVAVLQVAVPYRLPAGLLPHRPLVALGPRREVGGLSLLRVPFFDVAVGVQIVVAALALLGRRRLALIAMVVSVAYWVVYWAVFVYGISSVPDAMQLLTASAYLVGGVALLVSPDARQGRHLLSWRHWAVLLPAAALVQVTTLVLDMQSSALAFFLLGHRRDVTGYLVLSAALVVITVALVVILKLSWYFLLLLAVLFYPYAMQLIFSGVFRHGTDSDLLRLPTPGHLIVLFVPPVLFACAVLLIAAWPRRSVTTSVGRAA
jgi:hypothetical protein